MARGYLVSMLASIDIYAIQNIHVFDISPKMLFLHILLTILVHYCTFND